MEYKIGGIYQHIYTNGKPSSGFYRLDHYDPKTGYMDMYWWDWRNESSEKGYSKEDREYFRLASRLAQILYGN